MRKNYFIKVFALLVVTVIVFSTVSGCGSKKPVVSSSTSSSTATSTKNTQGNTTSTSAGQTENTSNANTRPTNTIPAPRLDNVIIDNAIRFGKNK